ncbi:MAG: hypothetical protein JWL88_89 [Parcubacteria group bacterium]|nr:hypothetical protein [Parcubacteria group bacterium]
MARTARKEPVTFRTNHGPALRALAQEDGTTVTDLVTGALEQFLKRRGAKPMDAEERLSHRFVMAAINHTPGVDISTIISLFLTKGDWSKTFADNELASHVLQNLSREETEELFKPILAEELKKALGAKEVSITW